jgi:RNA polymerase sigma-70 factor, ECF subfamily
MAGHPGESAGFAGGREANPAPASVRRASASEDHAADEALFRAARGGDAEAFAAVYDRFAPRVYGLIVKLLGRGPEAEDVLQDTMTELWTNIDRYDPALGSPTTWTLMLARSRALDQLRRRKRGAARAEELTRRAAAAGEPAPPEPAELPGRLSAALDQLPEAERAALQLAFGGGWTREEIARHLNVPTGTVKTRVRTGVRRLAELLGGADVRGKEVAL